MTEEFKDARLEELMLLARLERKASEPFQYTKAMDPARKQMVLTMVEQHFVNDESTFASWSYEPNFEQILRTARSVDENQLRVRQRVEFWTLLNKLYGDQPVDLRISHKGRVRLSELRQALKTGRDRDIFGILWDRRHALQDLHVALTSASKESPLSLLFLDMNGLKAANKRYGHGGADELLRHFHGLIQAGIVPPADAYRYGGDEVLVIMPGTPAEEAYRWSRALLTQLAAEPVRLRDEQVSLRACIGLATTDDPNKAAKDLLDRADEQSDRAKGDAPPEDRPSAIAIEGGTRQET